MANYQKIMRLRPEVRDFIQNRGWVQRGDITSYQPNLNFAGYSNDSHGFRHSTFQGEQFSLADCLRQERYGLVLGASNINGFGVAGNENTIPSLLAERFGFPFANLGMPGGNGRNLYSLLFSIFARAAQRPAAVVHFSGGDYSTFCKSSISDPVFGSPGQLLVETAVKERGGCPDAEKQLPGLLAFTSLWTSAIVQACLQREIAVVLGHDTTFFDKAEANELELQSDLGKPTHKWQVQQFANHRKFGDAFYNRRQHLAERLKVPLAGWGLNNDITFVDEFHCDRDGTHLLSDAVADALAPILEDVRVKSAATVE